MGSSNKSCLADTPLLRTKSRSPTKALEVWLKMTPAVTELRTLSRYQHNSLYHCFWLSIKRTPRTFHITLLRKTAVCLVCRLLFLKTHFKRLLDYLFCINSFSNCTKDYKLIPARLLQPLPSIPNDSLAVLPLFWYVCHRLYYLTYVNGTFFPHTPLLRTPSVSAIM